MGVVDTNLALARVIQGAALHIQLAKVAMVAAVVEIAAPTMTQVAAAWSKVLIKLHWGWPTPSVPVIFKLQWHWKSYQMTIPNDHWFCVCLRLLNKIFVEILLDAQTVQSPSVHQDVAVVLGGGGVGTHCCWSHGAMTMTMATTATTMTPWLPVWARTTTNTMSSSSRQLWLLLRQWLTVWNPPAWAFTDIDAVAHQLPVR
jgi:hypothetical protein